MSVLDEPLLPEEDAAGNLKIKPQTLASWRFRGQGPEYVKIGKLDLLRPKSDIRDTSPVASSDQRGRCGHERASGNHRADRQADRGFVRQDRDLLQEGRAIIASPPASYSSNFRPASRAGEAGKGVKWWVWYAEHFKDRTRRDAQRVMKLARSDDPDAAAAEEREKNRKAVAAHRKRAAEGEAQPEGTSDSKTVDRRRLRRTDRARRRA